LTFYQELSQHLNTEHIKDSHQ